MLNFSLNQDINYPCWVNIKRSRAVITDYSCAVDAADDARLWVPTLAGIWLPLGTRIALEKAHALRVKV